MAALLDHYGIPEGHPERWFLLAFELAKDHVGGFQFQGRKPGEKAYRSDRFVKDLIILVEMTRLIESGKSANNAAKILVKNGTIKNMKADSIRQRYMLLNQNSKEGRRLRDAIIRMGWVGSDRAI